MCSFEERLVAQRKERELAKEEELGFKKPLSKEEQVEKKKQRLAAIGNSSRFLFISFDHIIELIMN